MYIRHCSVKYHRKHKSKYIGIIYLIDKRVEFDAEIIYKDNYHTIHVNQI